MKRLLIIIINYSLLVINCSAQETLSLQKAYDLAEQNYPLVKQRDLIKQTSNLTIKNLDKGFLPQFSLSGQASYQSAVTEIDVQIPGFTINPHDKDQYKVLADINQLIYDGGVIKQQKNLQQLNKDVEEKKIDVELYKVKDRVSQLFLGILFLDEQLRQADLIKADLDIGIKRVEAQVNNGVAFRSNLDLLQAELLKADQRMIELRSSRKGLVDVLSLFINQQLPEDLQLEKPFVAGVTGNDILRPELNLFSSQNKLLGSQSKLIRARSLPKASFFLQGGYGKPGLNLFKNDFDYFYMTGLRFNWSLGSLYTQKREKKIIELSQKTVDIQKEVFLLNTNTQLKQQQSEIDKLNKLIATDKEIIDLRIKVKDAAKAQLENSVITANDYLREVNAEDQSRQSLIIHEIQLLQAQITYQTISGKQTPNP
jgi:outer membrane protein TolC